MEHQEREPKLDGPSSYDEKLARILKESAAVFAEKGYHRASIRDISAETGVSLSGLYYYFRSKEELLFLIQEHCFGTILEKLRQDLAGRTDPEEMLGLVIRNHLRFFANNMKEMKVLSVEADVLSGENARKVADLKREYARTVQEILESLQMSDRRTRRTEPGEEAGVSPKVATFSLFGMLNWIYTWYRPDRDVPVHRLAEEMAHVFLDGFRSPVPVRALPVPAGTDEGGDETSIWRTS